MAFNQTTYWNDIVKPSVETVNANLFIGGTQVYFLTVVAGQEELSKLAERGDRAKSPKLFIYIPELVLRFLIVGRER